MVFLAPHRWWVAASLQWKEIARDVDVGTGSPVGMEGREHPRHGYQR